MQRLLVLFLIVLAGCLQPDKAGPRSGHSSPIESPGPSEETNGTQLIVTPSRVVVGKITFVNPNARYAVISYPTGDLPPAGRQVNVYRSGLKVGEIKITGPERDLNTVGDIVAGDCLVGDEVRSD